MNKIATKKNKNVLYTIQPYYKGGQWQFDDASRNLYGEALIAGIPEIIQRVCADKGFSAPERGFSVVFGNQPFPGGDIVLEYVRSESGGNWYKLSGTNLEGWLCPALYLYLDPAPQQIYLRVESCGIRN